MYEINIEMLPREMLNIILQPFKSNEDSLVVGLVCKQWKSLVQIKPMNPFKIIQHHFFEGHDGLCSWTAKWIIKRAVHRGNTKFLEQLFGIKLAINKNTFEYQIEKIIKDGNLEKLKILKKKGTNFNENECYYYWALLNKQFEIVKWLLINGVKWKVIEFRFIVMYADINFIKWLYYNNYSWDSQVILVAIKRNNMEIIEFLYEKKCPLSANCFNYTSNIQMMEWLIDRNCPINKSVCSSASYLGNLDFEMVKIKELPMGFGNSQLCFNNKTL